MTDLQKLKNVLDELNIGYYVKEYEENNVLILEGNLVTGSSYTEFQFSSKGKILEVGAWEN